MSGVVESKVEVDMYEVAHGFPADGSRLTLVVSGEFFLILKDSVVIEAEKRRDSSRATEDALYLLETHLNR